MTPEHNESEALRFCLEVIELERHVSALVDHVHITKHFSSGERAVSLFLAHEALKSSQVKLQQTLKHLQQWM